MAMLVPIRVCEKCGYESFEEEDRCKHMKEPPTKAKGKSTIVHRRTEYKRIYKGTLQTSARLCNPYDTDASTSTNDDDVTCKLCRRIMNSKKDGFELKLIHNSRGSWKEHIKFTESKEEFMRKLDAIVNQHGADVYGSYKASFKLNGGYANNKEKGTTQILTWKGRLDRIYSLIWLDQKAGGE